MRKIPFASKAQGQKHGRDTLWEMRALAEGFRNAVGSPGTHQGELARRQLDYRDDKHNRDPQRKLGGTGPPLPHKPADKARGSATSELSALEH